MLESIYSRFKYATLSKYLIPLILILFLFPYNFEDLFSSRLLRISSLIISDPLTFFYLDNSSSDRIANIFFSFKGFIDNFGFPHGFVNWSEYVNSNFTNFSFPNITTGRIMSTYGSMLFELGVFGLIYFLFIFNRIRKSYVTRFYVYGLNFMLIFAIPIATPMLSILLNNFILKDYEIIRKNKFL